LQNQPLPQNRPLPAAASGAAARPHKPMTWGEPTWFLFHTLSQKVKEESFAIIKGELINTFFTICRFLPCPTCAEHATQYMKNINFSRIQTKQQLIDMFFHFHNSVNSRKGFPLFQYADLEAKYNAANTAGIIANFLQKFSEKNNKIDFFRHRAIYQIRDWLNTHIHHFN
jgi:hypothetical protein